jgi:catechol 2,3-dioxygenase-like lactoylglutathione lyase family enzyme
MEHVGIVVDDLAAATAFFVEPGKGIPGPIASWSVR